MMWMEEYAFSFGILRTGAEFILRDVKKVESYRLCFGKYLEAGVCYCDLDGSYRCWNSMFAYSLDMEFELKFSKEAIVEIFNVRSVQTARKVKKGDVLNFKGDFQMIVVLCEEDDDEWAVEAVIVMVNGALEVFRRA